MSHFTPSVEFSTVIAPHRKASGVYVPNLGRAELGPHSLCYYYPLVPQQYSRLFLRGREGKILGNYTGARSGSNDNITCWKPKMQHQCLLVNEIDFGPRHKG